jgi:hypothetical protein
MTTETKPDRRDRKAVQRGADSSVYGLGFIGALIYYISTAASLGAGLLGVLKAIVWPAMLVYEVLQYLHM